jgi:hypothetical protein
MVTSHKMNENEMGNRGSKSELNITNSVKEQRVDGSYFEYIFYPKLRCTLMDCESNYQISIPSNQFIIQKRNLYIQSSIFRQRCEKEELEQVALVLPSAEEIHDSSTFPLKLDP